MNIKQFRMLLKIEKKISMKDKRLYKFNIFEEEGVVCGISTRILGSVKENEKINQTNLKKITKALGVDALNVIFPKQIHSSSISFISNLNENIIGEADGLITNKKKLFLGIVTADCLPICFWDKKRGLVGIVHAGYKGILKGIVSKMISEFEELGSNIKDIKIGVGPSIGWCCYDVDNQRIEMFKKKFNKHLVYKKVKDKSFLNLQKTVANTLLDKGIRKENLEVSDICTKCDLKTFFSYRGDRKETFGQFATIIGQI